MPDEPQPDVLQPDSNPSPTRSLGDLSQQAAPGREPPPEEQAETAATATEEEGGEDKPSKLVQKVDIADAGPCKKHVRVEVERASIDERLELKYSKLVPESNVTGFRPGKAPRKLVIRRYQKEITDQVKAEVVLESLEQLAEEQKISPLSAPDLDPYKIELPKDGPLVYEFQVEVRPEFDLPNYRGLKIKRPSYTITDEDVAREEQRILAPYGQLVPKPEGSAQVGDTIVADITFRHGDNVLGQVAEAPVRVEPRLAFRDGVAERFGEQVQGANAGDTRTVDVVMADVVANPELRGQPIQAVFQIKDVKQSRPPELTHEFLHNFGVHSVEQLREVIRVGLQRRLEYQQRQSAREQILAQLGAAANLEVPPEMLRKQARKALERQRMEMQANGMSEEDINNRLRLAQQDILRNTEKALREQFVLQKVADLEKIDVSDEELEMAIDRIAEMNNESPRRLRARLEREEQMDVLAAELVEQRALQLILDSAEYEDTPVGASQEQALATVEQQAVPGELQDPTAAPEETPPAEGTPEATSQTS
jgi:trigger factor